MTGEKHRRLMVSVILFAWWGTLWVDPVGGSPMGLHHIKPWESFEEFFGHSFRKDDTTEGSDENAGCLPDCEEEGAFYPDRTSCNHFFVCTNHFEMVDKRQMNLLKEQITTSKSLSDDFRTLSLVRCSCPGKRDVYNRYLQRCSRRGHCRVSCTAQGNVFENWTSVAYNGYQCSVASLSTDILVDSGNNFHTTSKTSQNEESAVFDANEARGNLPEEVYQLETNHPELFDGAEYIHDTPDTKDQVTSLPLSSDIINVQTSSHASVIISATVLPATIQLPIVLSETTQFPVTQSSLFQESESLFGTADTTADFQDTQSETLLTQDTLSVTISAVNSKPGTIKTPVLWPSKTFSSDYAHITITPDVSTFLTQNPLTLPAHIPVTDENHGPVTLPATIQKPPLLPATEEYPNTFPVTSQIPVILPATILKPVVLPATIQKPDTLPGTLQMSTVSSTSVQTPITQTEIIPKPAVFPEVTEIQIPLPDTNQMPTVFPEPIQKPVVLPELIQKPIPLQTIGQIPTVLPATIQKPTVLPELISSIIDQSEMNQLPTVLPETVQMPSQVENIGIAPSLLPETILLPATLPLVITESGSMSEQTSLTEISLTPTKLPNQDPSSLQSNNPSPVILPATIQKPATLPAIIQTVSSMLESGQVINMISSIIPVVLPTTIENLQTTHPLTMVTASSQYVMTLPAIVQSSATQTVTTQKPIILPETIGAFTSSPSALPVVTLPGIVQTTQISPSLTQINSMSSTHQVSLIQSQVILPTTALLGESSSTMLPQGMNISTSLPTLELKPAACRPVKCRVANTRFPNPKDCTRYYKCVMHRGELIARPYICPSVMPTFSPSLMMCLRGIKCQPTCSDKEVPVIPSSSVMTTRIDSMQG